MALLFFLLFSAGVASALNQTEKDTFRLKNMAHYRLFQSNEFQDREFVGLSVSESSWQEALEMGFSFLKADFSLLESDFLTSQTLWDISLKENRVFYLLLTKSGENQPNQKENKAKETLAKQKTHLLLPSSNPDLEKTTDETILKDFGASMVLLKAENIRTLSDFGFPVADLMTPLCSDAEEFERCGFRGLVDKIEDTVGYWAFEIKTESSQPGNCLAFSNNRSLVSGCPSQENIEVLCRSLEDAEEIEIQSVNLKKETKCKENYEWSSPRSHSELEYCFQNMKESYLYISMSFDIFQKDFRIKNGESFSQLITHKETQGSPSRVSLIIFAGFGCFLIVGLIIVFLFGLRRTFLYLKRKMQVPGKENRYPMDQSNNLSFGSTAKSSEFSKSMEDSRLDDQSQFMQAKLALEENTRRSHHQRADGKDLSIETPPDTVERSNRSSEDSPRNLRKFSLNYSRLGELAEGAEHNNQIDNEPTSVLRGPEDFQGDDLVKSKEKILRTSSESKTKK